RPRRAPLACDVEPVAHEMVPAFVRPDHTLLRADLVAHHDVAAIADAPAAFDGTQTEVQLFPAEEEPFVVAVPRRTTNCMAGTDKGHRLERLICAGQELRRIAPR